MGKNNILILVISVAFGIILANTIAQCVIVFFLTEECRGVESRSDPRYSNCLQVVVDGIFDFSNIPQSMAGILHVGSLAAQDVPRLVIQSMYRV